MTGRIPHGDALPRAELKLDWRATRLAAVLIAASMTLSSPLSGPLRAQIVSDPSSHAREAETQTADHAGRASTASRGLANSDPAEDSDTTSDLGPLVPEDDATQDPADEPVLRQAVRDGDLADPAEASADASNVDGVVADGEPPQSQDGANPALVDSRSAEDIAVFENPPAGHDPLLFQIEDIDPARTDRRPARLARIEPYDPVGIRIGSFVYFPELDLAGVSTNNVLRAPKADSDVYAEINSTSRLVSSWEAHALEVRSTSLMSFHEAYPTEDDRAWSLEARGRLDVTRRTNIQGLLSHDVRQEGRSAIDASGAGERPDVNKDEAAVTLNHRLNRLSFLLRGTRTTVDYSDTSAKVGAMIVRTINDDRDSSTNEEALRVKWELKPTFAAFVEVEMDQREFEAPAQSDNLSRDSTGERWRFGADFGRTGTLLRGEVSLGWGRQTPDDPNLEEVDAVLIDANLAWRLTEMTSLRFNAQTDIYDTTTAGSSGVVSHAADLEVRHAFRPYLIGTAGLALSGRDYASNPLEETELRATLGAEYFVNREIILFGRYQHIAFDANSPAGDYHADDVRLGVRWRR